MSRSRIIITHYFAKLETQNETIPLVPGRIYELDPPAILITRLHSTRAGNNAWWAAGPNARQCLNASPYNPMLRAFVKLFQWRPPDTKDNLSQFDKWNVPEQFTGPENSYIWQGGSAVINWWAMIDSPIPDPLGEMIREFIINTHIDYTYKQGHLEVAQIYIYDGDQNERLVDMLPLAGSGYRHLYNHYIYPLSRWAWRVIDNIAYAIFIGKGFYVLDAEQEIHITSTDHNEPLVLGAHRALYIARHPLPDPRRGVD